MIKNPEKIGRYQVLERVGCGGMGVLYRAFDSVLDREVAIKLMLADFSEDAEQMRPRFYREARAIAKLQHRHIVTVFEFAEEGDTPYIVMEFLRGESLAARMTSTPPLTLDDKLDVVCQLCDGLHYAHEQGVVHRDVKPANVFVLTDGSVKLLDFGIAKVLTSTLTRQGDILGSASYMSPEQVIGSESVDRRADIFSTGALLYELLSGRNPFDAETPTAIIMKILKEDAAPIESVVPALPPALAAVITRALQKDPVNRQSTAAELGRELQMIRRTLPTSIDLEVAPDATRLTHADTQSTTTAFTRAPFADAGPIAAATRVLPADGAQPVVTSAPPAATPPRRWIVPAGLAVVVLVGVAIAATLGRGTTRAGAVNSATEARPLPDPPAARTPAPAKDAGNAATKTPAVAQASEAGATVQIETDPPGAAIALDGQDLHLQTPARVPVQIGSPHRLRLSKRGFQPVDVHPSDREMRGGLLSYTLKAAEAATIPVLLSGAYPFEVFDGPRSISPAGTSHELNLPPGKTVRLVASEYLLAQTVRIEPAADKRFEYRVPELGRLTVRSNLETCKVKIGDHDLGFPPTPRIQIAAGTYAIDLVCPNNAPGGRVTATVPPGPTGIIAKVP